MSSTKPRPTASNKSHAFRNRNRNRSSGSGSGSGSDSGSNNGDGDGDGNGDRSNYFGPWSKPVVIQEGTVSSQDTNMAAIILKNGSVNGLWRSKQYGGIHRVTAALWSDPSSYDWHYHVSILVSLFSVLFFLNSSLMYLYWVSLSIPPQDPICSYV